MKTFSISKNKEEIMNKIFLATLVALIISGCTSVPPIDFTVQDVGMVSQRKNAELKSLTVGYATQVQQKKVQSGYAIPGIWKEALTDALNRSLVFRDGSDQTVNLSVRITEVDTPEMGFAMTTKVSAIYEIIDRNTGDLLMAEEVRSEGVVPMDYAFMGVTRAVESLNRAVRNNIAEFISRLEGVDLDKPVFRGN